MFPISFALSVEVRISGSPLTVQKSTPPRKTSVLSPARLCVVLLFHSSVFFRILCNLVRALFASVCSSGETLSVSRPGFRPYQLFSALRALCGSAFNVISSGLFSLSFSLPALRFLRGLFSYLGEEEMSESAFSSSRAGVVRQSTPWRL